MEWFFIAQTSKTTGVDNVIVVYTASVCNTNVVYRRRWLVEDLQFKERHLRAVSVKMLRSICGEDHLSDMIEKQ